MSSVRVAMTMRSRWRGSDQKKVFGRKENDREEGKQNKEIKNI